MEKVQSRLPLLLLGIFGIWSAITPTIIPLLGTLASSIAVFFWYKKKTEQKKLIQRFELLKDFGPSQQSKETWIAETKEFTQSNTSVLALHTAFCWLENQLSEGSVQEVKSTLGFLPIQPVELQKITTYIYQTIVDESLADHQLSTKEENLLKEIESKWEIPPHKIKEEASLIKQFQELRLIEEKELSETSFSRALVRGEQAYFEGKGKFLTRRILQSWQENKQRVKEIGFQIDLEGILRIGSRQIEIEDGRQNRSYPINQIENITLSLEDGVIELSLRNRKNPVILTSEDLITVAGIIQKLTFI
ncbi:DUF4236 domain-containing protein [Mongoliitalea daihaiensis]|uniref:DUF4236 domain-containing protein n=1 Tax=Mongoliitalea daihaiensis TaxID=2782006 RepID=UPI001F342D01|nr:DUF4236 domain-containing protein [Mongoliitalea daihaiensis]